MKKTIMTVLLCAVLLSQITQVFANDGNVSREIDRIETAGNSRTVYHKDGSKDVFVTSSVNFDITLSTGIAHVTSVPPSPYTFPFEKIFDILREIIESVVARIGIGCTLLAWRIWSHIKKLRHDRPKDYNGVYWN